MQESPLLDPNRYPIRFSRPRGFAQAYVRLGEEGGRALLLVHGWPETARIWWRNIEPLAAAGFDVIAPDLRGFGQSESAPDGYGDTVSHSRDLYALVHEELGIETVIAVAGDLGAAVIQDLSLRHPGFVEQLVVFNGPLPHLESMGGPPRRPEGPALDYYLRQGNDPDGLIAELATPEGCQAYIANFYTERAWAAPGQFDAAAVAFHSEPFANPARLRETFKAYQSALHKEHRVQRPFWEQNPNPTLILFGTADAVMSPDWDAQAVQVFPNHTGPIRVKESGHFLQWEAAERLNAELCRRLGSAPGVSPARRAFISLGSNLGKREQQLCAALAALRSTPGVRDVVVSPIYETAAVGPGDQGPYLNAAARLRTTLTPEALLKRLLEIEDLAGRVRTERNAARVLDLDLLLYEDRCIDTPLLQLPHPRMHERCFVLEPLLDLAPELVHPGLGKRLSELAAHVRDPAAAKRRF